MADPHVTGEHQSDCQTGKNSQFSDYQDKLMASEEENATRKGVLEELGDKSGDSPLESCEQDAESRSKKLENGTNNSLGAVVGQENGESRSPTKVTKEQSEVKDTNPNHAKSESLDELHGSNSEEKSNIIDELNTTGLGVENTCSTETVPQCDKDTGSQKYRESSPHSEEMNPVNHGGGSCRSPDKQSKAEYRKIKSEVTGEGETSESEGENEMETDKKEAKGNQKTADESSKAPADSWIDMLGNGLLKKRVSREGKGRDTRPDKGQIVTVQVAGRMEDGTGVDWSNSLEFILGDGEVIQALDLAVALMELDEVCELVTDSKYAYGKMGKPQANPPIPPDANLTYEIHLLAVRDGPNIANMSVDEVLKIGEKKRELGNTLYTTEDYSGAINSYQRAIKYLASSGSEEVQSLRVKCWNNMAAAQLKIGAYSAAENSCAQVLQVDPENVKALFRKGKVLAQQGDTKQALYYIKKADHLDPSNKTIRVELTRLKQLEASEKQNERNLYRRMVGDLANKDKKSSSRTFLGWPLVLGATVVALGGILVTLYLSRH